jgi:hypothetical protein
LGKWLAGFRFSITGRECSALASVVESAHHRDGAAAEASPGVTGLDRQQYRETYCGVIVLVALLAFGWLVANVVVVLRNPKRRRMEDHLANTVVVFRKRGSLSDAEQQMAGDEKDNKMKTLGA